MIRLRISDCGMRNDPTPTLPHRGGSSPSCGRGLGGGRSVAACSVLFFLCIFLTALPVFASTPKHSPVILVIADYLTLDDLESSNLPNIQNLLHYGFAGLISPSSIGRKTEGSAYASVGAGTYLRGLDSIDEAYSSDEDVLFEKSTAGQVFSRRTGLPAPEHGVVNLSLGTLQRVNEPYNRDTVVGQLGRCLRLAGKKVAVFGNSDVGDWLRRPAVVVAMDDNGIVPMGDVSTALLKKEPMSPTGWATDVPKMADAVDKAAAKVDLIVVDFGDTSRVFLSQTELSVGAYEKYRKESLKNLDAFLGRIVKTADKTYAKLIFASLVSPEEEKNKWTRLTPMIMYENGRTPADGGCLYSPTTRKSGLVAGVDLAPSILSYCGIDIPSEMLGRSIEYSISRETLTALNYMSHMTESSSTLQWPLLSAAAVIGGLLVTLASVTVAFGFRLTRIKRSLLRMGLVLGYSIICGFLFGGLRAETVRGTVVGVVIGTLSITICAYIVAIVAGRLLKSNGLFHTALPMIGVFLISVLIIALDAFTGTRLIGSSIVSFYYLAGFRFYGIGNEYMGVMIGSALTAMLWLSIGLGSKELSWGRKSVILLAAIAVVVILGWPGLGANAGGGIAAIVTLGLGYKAVTKGVCRKRDALVLIGASVVIILITALIDAYLNGASSSHIGFAARLAGKTGFVSAFETMSRKILMNLSLIGTKQSRMALLGFSPFLAIWFIFIQKKVRLLYNRYPRLKPGLSAGMIGAAVAFIFNDSGVISAAIIIASIVCALLYTLLEESNYAADNGA